MLSRYALIGLLLAVPAPAVAGQGRPTVTPTPPPLDPMPRSCPGAPRPVVLKNVFGSGPDAPTSRPASMWAGTYPVWGGFGGPHATVAVGTLPGDFAAPYGWGAKMLWVLSPRFKGRVTLQGGLLHGHASLAFDVVEKGAPNTPTRIASLEARRQKAYSGGPDAWPEFPSTFYIPRAGCYYIEARWPGGTWRMTFAAGR